MAGPQLRRRNKKTKQHRRLGAGFLFVEHQDDSVQGRRAACAGCPLQPSAFGAVACLPPFVSQPLSPGAAGGWEKESTACLPSLSSHPTRWPPALSHSLTHPRTHAPSLIRTGSALLQMHQGQTQTQARVHKIQNVPKTAVATRAAGTPRGAGAGTARVAGRRRRHPGPGSGRSTGGGGPWASASASGRPHPRRRRPGAGSATPTAGAGPGTATATATGGAGSRTGPAPGTGRRTGRHRTPGRRRGRRRGSRPGRRRRRPRRAHGTHAQSARCRRTRSTGCPARGARPGGARRPRGRRRAGRCGRRTGRPPPASPGCLETFWLREGGKSVKGRGRGARKKRSLFLRACPPGRPLSHAEPSTQARRFWRFSRHAARASAATARPPPPSSSLFPKKNHHAPSSLRTASSASRGSSNSMNAKPGGRRATHTFFRVPNRPN